jgi:uncharacterized protein YceH (UPF0502 family)
MDCKRFSTPVRVRNLGSKERYYADGQEEYSHGILVFYVLVKSKTTLQLEQIKEVLRRLQQRQQALRLTITTVEESGQRERYFKELPGSDVNFKTLSTSDVRKAVEKEQRFEDGKLLWRVSQMMCQTKELHYPFLFTFHHVAFDGTSAISGVIKNFVTYLDNSVRNVSSCCLVESLPLLPPRELLQFRSATNCKREAQMSKDAFEKSSESPKLSANRPSSEEVKVKAMDERRKEGAQVMRRFYEVHRTVCPEPVTGLVQISFNADQTKMMVENCKYRGVKMTGFCTAVASMAMLKFLSQKGVEFGDFYTEIRCTVNLRPFAIERIAEEQLGMAFSECTPIVQLLQVNDESFWRIAKSYHKALHHLIREGQQYEVMEDEDLLCKQLPIREMFSNEIKSTKTFFGMSNCGRLDLDERQDPSVSLEEVFFASNMTFKTSTLCFHNILTINGRMASITF